MDYEDFKDLPRRTLLIKHYTIEHLILLKIQNMIDIKEIFRPMGLCEAATRHIYAKVDLLPIDSESEKKKVAKKHKPFQIPQKLLFVHFM